MKREELDLSQEQKINFNLRPSLSFSGGEINDEPVGIYITPAGWEDKFHVVVEFGDMETFDTYFLTSKQIKDKWNLEVKRQSLKEIIRNFPNDQELGKYIRKMYNANM